MRKILLTLAALGLPALSMAQATRQVHLDSSHAEDSAHTSTDTGQMCLGVRNNAGTALAADGDYIPFMMNSSGELMVAASCTVGGVVEDVAEAGADTLAAAGAVVRAGKTGSSATAGDFATVNVDAAGGLWSASDQIEDAAETAATPLSMCGTVRRDTQASSAGTAGDNATLNTDASGNLWVSGTYIEDAAETAGGQLMMAGTVRRDTLATSAGTTGDNATLNTNALGALYTINTGAASMTCAQVNITSTGTAEQGATNTCKYVLVSCEGANTGHCYVTFQAGNGTTAGMEIAKGTSAVRFDVNNTNLLWFDAANTNDDVGWCCIN